MNEAALRAWLDAYGEAWERQSPDAAAIFTDDGRCQVFREWWNEEPPATGASEYAD